MQGKFEIGPSKMSSALTVRDFVPRLELLSPFRDFRKSMKVCEMNYFSLFCKWYLVLFLTCIIRTPILCCTTTDLGIFWYCSRDFWSCKLWEPWKWARAFDYDWKGGFGHRNESLPITG